MKSKLAAAGAILVWGGMPAASHRLDEYLQATMISVEKDRIEAQMSLTPGVAVLPIVLEGIDTDSDGALSRAEQRAYAERVLRDVSLTIDGERSRLRLVSTTFPDPEEMKEGRGHILIDLLADPPRSRSRRRLIFENHHQTRIAAYLVNCVAPRGPDIRVTAQKRNYLQSRYELDYVQSGARAELLPPVWAGTAALLLLAPAAAVWRLGRR